MANCPPSGAYRVSHTVEYVQIACPAGVDKYWVSKVEPMEKLAVNAYNPPNDPRSAVYTVEEPLGTPTKERGVEGPPLYV